MIEVFNKAHVHAVTQMHMCNLNGLLRDLGPCATGAFYHGAARSSCAIGFVYIQEGQIAGFVLGSANPHKMRSEILAKSFFRTLAGMCVGVVRKPATFRSLLAFLPGSANNFDSKTAELTYIAVDSKLRSSGIGKRLVEHFSQKLGELNVAAYELSVDDDNQAALRFYQRLGFVEAGRYEEFGISRKRLRKALR